MQSTLEQPQATSRKSASTTPTVISIGAIADYYGVSTESLRNWERAGLIPEARRTPGGHRRYTRDHILAIHRLLTRSDRHPR